MPANSTAAHSVLLKAPAACTPGLTLCSLVMSVHRFTVHRSLTNYLQPALGCMQPFPECQYLVVPNACSMSSHHCSWLWSKEQAEKGLHMGKTMHHMVTVPV